MGALMDLVERHKEQTIVVATHAGTIRTILCSVLNIPLKYLWSIKQDNTAVNVIEFSEDKALVSLINDIHHLDSL
jgi:alpha-ribazole phosphatase